MISSDILHGFSLLSGLDSPFLEELRAISELHSVEAGVWLFHKDDHANALYLIKTGNVDLKLRLDEKRALYVPVTALGAGDAFGWSAIVAPYTYNLAAVSTAPSELVKVDGEKLRALLESHPEQGYVFMQGIAQAMATRFGAVSERAPGLSWRLVLSAVLFVLGALMAIVVVAGAILAIVTSGGDRSGALAVTLFCAIFPVTFLFLAGRISPNRPSGLSMSHNAG